MAKYGKWIGGGLGWVLGGPIGAILGFVFGGMFDSMQSGEFEYREIHGDKGRQPYGRKTQSGDFSISLLVLSAAIMKADGKVLKSELNYVRQFFQQQFGAELGNQQVSMLREILKQNINVQEVSMQIKQNMDYSSRLQLLHYLFGISEADGHIHASEIETIHTVSRYIGIRNPDFESIKAMFVKDTTSAYKILEISPDATDEEVKKAYRKMAVKYHPDKVSHLGEDIQKAAKEKFQKVNASYEQIKKERGIN